ncbi:MAG: hypothetical protein P8Z00_08745 [Anaerolineales bacterium]|jgi:hypothetical protein
MYRLSILCMCMVLFSAFMAAAQDVKKDKQMTAAKGMSENGQMAATQDVSEDEQMATAKGVNEDKHSKAKELSGMSVVGNDEAPKSLYIVPWKSSEIGVETSLDMMLSEDDVPVDRDVFKRQLEFYQISTKK